MTHAATIKPLALGSLLQERGAFVEHFYQDPEAPLHAAAKDAIRRLYTSQSYDSVLDTLHLAQRLYLLAKTGLDTNPQMLAAMQDRKHFPLWSGYADLPASETEKTKLADLLYNGDVLKRKRILMNLSDYGRDIAEKCVALGVAEQAELDIWITDLPFQRRILNQLDEEQATKFGDLMSERYWKSERRIVTSAAMPASGYCDPKPSDAVQTAYDLAFSRGFHGSRQFFTGTSLPTPYEAELDGMTYDEAVRTYFNAIAADSDKARQANAALIARLNKGSMLRFRNSDGTDLCMDIGDYTFLNSLTECNIPGFEVFSAPEKTSVNGIVVAKGRFMPPMTDDLIEDITLEFKDGRIIRYDAAVGYEYLQKQIETDEGSHYLGEIAFGTNPALTRHSVNGLYVEKIGCSFHFALGNAYEDEDDAHIDNGNRSLVHWDITVMLAGKDGLVTLDDEILVEKGRYVDPAMAFFNGPA